MNNVFFCIPNSILLEQAEERIKTLKNELEKQHQLWRAAQTNYERQVDKNISKIYKACLLYWKNLWIPVKPKLPMLI